jgi:hypothetical protein
MLCASAGRRFLSPFGVNDLRAPVAGAMSGAHFDGAVNNGNPVDRFSRVIDIVASPR